MKFSLLCLVIVASQASQAIASEAQTCSARSSATVTPVVELYTSEGCNSCPPADRWLSGLTAQPQVVALAFHVDYWDRLGWKDRFASAAFTRRQMEQLPHNGARFAYTPQVVVDGRDQQGGVRLDVVNRAAAAVNIELVREGERVNANVVAAAQGPTRLAAYWALTESRHRTAVKAGENEGVTLAHDFVVRDYRPVGEWTATPGTPQRLSFGVSLPADAEHPRRINLVIVDAVTGRPVQALALGC